MKRPGPGGGWRRDQSRSRAATGDMPRMVAHHASTRGAAPALRFEGRTWSYAELDDAARRAAWALAALGVRTGDRVALLLPNVPEFVFAWLGALHLGAVATSLSTAWSTEQLRAALDDADAAVLVTSVELLRRLAAEGSPIPVRRVVLVGDDAEDAAAEQSHARRDAFLPLAASWSLMLDTVGTFPRPSRAEPIAPHAPASILYTSGTTGTPRGVVLSARALAGNALAKARYCGFTPSDGVAIVVPLFHCYGQNAVLAAALAAGACAVLHRRFSADALLDDVIAGRVTALLGVPPVFQRLLDAADRDASAHAALRRLRFAFSAATTLPAPIAARWRDATGHVIHEGYGLTESGPFAAFNHRHTHVAGSLGTPISRVTMAIADPESGRLLGPDAAGEIVIRGPYLMTGYWRRPADTARVLRDGWLHTGDIGYRDPMGWFHLLERMDDLVKVSGFRVYPSQVERVLAAHAAVRDAAVFGLSDPERGERVEAAVVLDDTSPRALEAVLRHCRTHLAPYEVPRRLHPRRELPRNATGKVMRRELREALAR